MPETSIALAIIVNDAKEVLLVERANQETLSDGTELTWAFPGGKQEPGEDSSQTAERETYEETGYVVKAKTVLFQGQHPQAPVTVSYWACNITRESKMPVVTDMAIRTVAWVAISSLSDYITSSMHPAVQDYLERMS